MIKKILKWFLVISIVLLVGQVPIGKDTVGAWYQKNVFTLAQRVTLELKNTKVFSNLVQAQNLETAPPALQQVAEKTPTVVTPRIVLKPKSIQIPEKNWEGENVTQTDKERLMRLLR